MSTLKVLGSVLLPYAHRVQRGVTNLVTRTTPERVTLYKCTRPTVLTGLGTKTRHTGDCIDVFSCYISGLGPRISEHLRWMYFRVTAERSALADYLTPNLQRPQAVHDRSCPHRGRTRALRDGRGSHQELGFALDRMADHATGPKIHRKPAKLAPLYLAAGLRIWENKHETSGVLNYFEKSLG